MPEFVYRVMIEDPVVKGRPLIGETHLTLGPRVPWDVVPDQSNYIAPKGPDGKPQGIAVFTTPQAACGAVNAEVGDQYPVWQIDVKVFAAHQLAVLPRDASPGGEEGLVLATMATVSWPEYWYHIAQTQSLWIAAGEPAGRAVLSLKLSRSDDNGTSGGDSPAAPARKGDEDMKKTRSRSGDPNECVRSPLDGQRDGAVVRYWTPEREYEAQPRPMERVDDPEVIEAIEAVLEDHSKCYRADPTTSLVDNITLHPFAAVGRLNFLWEGKPYHGSAWIINTEPLGIVTAAHNVYVYDPSASDKPAWAENVIFKLQYADGSEAAIWEIAQSIVLKGWFDSNKKDVKKDYGRDFAVLVPKSEVKDQPALDVLLDQTAESYRGLGYPGVPLLPRYDFRGKYMWQSAGAQIHAGLGLVSAYNNLTAGSSGGPWCARHEDRWVANGLQSHGGTSDDISISPYLTAETFGALLACGGLTL